MAFGGLRALGGVDLDVAHGDRLAVLGPNGAGKTTLFNVIAGDITPTDGQRRDQGRSTAPRSPSRLRPSLGVARTYQKTRLFAGLTVEDNLYLAQTGKAGRHLAMLAQQPGRRDARAGAPRSASASGCAVTSTTWSGDLSHGQQRQLEIGMAIATDPGSAARRAGVRSVAR